MRNVLAVSAAIVLALGSGLLVAYVVSGDVDISPISTPATGSTGAAPASSDDEVRFRLDGVAVESFTETVERPLFWSTRRPKPADAAITPANPPGVEMRLVGVMRGENGKPRALLVSPQHPIGRWLEEGGEIDGWRLTRIGSNAIHLESGGRRHELRMN